jgi:hypothetical protein
VAAGRACLPGQRKQTEALRRPAGVSGRPWPVGSIRRECLVIVFAAIAVDLSASGTGSAGQSAGYGEVKQSS